VPCSGDGTLRKNPVIWTSWDVKFALTLHTLQLKLLCRALHHLKPGACARGWKRLADGPAREGRMGVRHGGAAWGAGQPCGTAAEVTRLGQVALVGSPLSLVHQFATDGRRERSRGSTTGSDKPIPSVARAAAVCPHTRSRIPHPGCATKLPHGSSTRRRDGSQAGG
jgi:hypothetical protein